MAKHPARTPEYLTVVAGYLVLFAGSGLRAVLTWWGYGLIALALTGAVVWFTVTSRRTLAMRHIPVLLTLFVVWAAASVFWSGYQLASLFGIAALIAALLFSLLCAQTLTFTQRVRSLSTALRATLALSLLVEVLAWLSSGTGGLLRLFPDAGFFGIPMRLPAIWLPDHLGAGTPISGVTDGPVMLELLAVLALIVFGAEFVDASRRRRASACWILVALVTLGLSRAAVAGLMLATVTVVAALAVLARRSGRRERRIQFTVTFVVVVVVTLATALNWSRIVDALQGFDPLASRVAMWHSVAEVGGQWPVAGQGYVGAWAPWEPFFSGFTAPNGQPITHAYSTWLDAWLQVGYIGLVIFALNALFTLVKTWWMAVDHRRRSPSYDEPFSARQLVPLLVMTALLTVSVFSSTLLYGAGLALLGIATFTTKMRFHEITSPSEHAHATAAVAAGTTVARAVAAGTSAGPARPIVGEPSPR